MGQNVTHMTGYLMSAIALEQVTMDQNANCQAWFLLKTIFSKRWKIFNTKSREDCDPSPCVNGNCDFNPLKVNDPYCDCGIGFNGTACETTVCDTNKELFHKTQY